VSVMCGILRLNVPQMLLGTSPVIFVLSPCVLAGAFLGRATGNGESVEDMLAQVFTAAAACGQMGSMLMAVHATTAVVDSHAEELARPRPEHECVRLLTEREAKYQAVYKAVTRWAALPAWLKAVVVPAAALMLLSGSAFAFLGDMCFRPFTISSRIYDPIEKRGLGGNPWEIVLQPGWYALAIFTVAWVLHVAFSLSVTSLTRQQLLREASAEVELANMNEDTS